MEEKEDAQASSEKGWETTTPHVPMKIWEQEVPPPQRDGYAIKSLNKKMSPVDTEAPLKAKEIIDPGHLVVFQKNPWNPR